jgi:predicted nucleic acid-binding protein
VEKQDIASKVEKILNAPNLVCPETSQIIMALDLYVQENIDFVDAYHAYYMKDREIGQIVTYDRKHFGRVPREKAPSWRGQGGRVPRIEIREP